MSKYIKLFEEFVSESAKGHKPADAIEYGKSLVDKGYSTIKIRKEVEANYPGLKDSLVDIMDKILNYKDSLNEASKWRVTNKDNEHFGKELPFVATGKLKKYGDAVILQIKDDGSSILFPIDDVEKI